MLTYKIKNNDIHILIKTPMNHGDKCRPAVTNSIHLLINELTITDMCIKCRHIVIKIIDSQLQISGGKNPTWFDSIKLTPELNDQFLYLIEELKIY